MGQLGLSIIRPHCHLQMFNFSLCIREAGTKEQSCMPVTSPEGAKPAENWVWWASEPVPFPQTRTARRTRIPAVLMY